MYSFWLIQLGKGFVSYIIIIILQVIVISPRVNLNVQEAEKIFLNVCIEYIYEILCIAYLFN